VRQHVGVVSGEIQQVCLVEHTADLAEVALGVFHRADVRVLGCSQDRLVFDRDAGAAGDVVQDDREVGGIRNHAEVGEYPGLGGLVVIRRDDHDAVGARLLARPVQLDRVGGLVRPATGDDFGPPRRDRHRHLDELQLLRVRQRAGLAGGSRDNDSVSTGLDDVVDVLLDV
jgi:hypothetical protein